MQILISWLHQKPADLELHWILKKFYTVLAIQFQQAKCQLIFIIILNLLLIRDKQLQNTLQFCRLQIWSLTNGSIIKEVSHTDKITCLTCSSNSQYLVTGSIDRSVKVWELPTGKIVQVYQYLVHRGICCMSPYNIQSKILIGNLII